MQAPAKYIKKNSRGLHAFLCRGSWLGLRVRICVRLSFGVRPRVRVGIRVRVTVTIRFRVRVRARQDKRGGGGGGDHAGSRAARFLLLFPSDD